MSKILSRCTECGSEAKVEKGSYRFRESGLDNVVLKGIDIIKCPVCANEEPIIPHLEGLLRALAIAVVAQKTRLTGAEIRYLRKYVGMNGGRFADLLHTDKTTLSKWENDAVSVGSKSDLLIRAIALHLIKSDGAAAERIVRDFGLIDEDATGSGSRIELDSETLEYAYA